MRLLCFQELERTFLIADHESKGSAVLLLLYARRVESLCSIEILAVAHKALFRLPQCSLLSTAI
jgi:hypothetical protein